MIITIVGPTGVGKTDLSLALAKEFDAEIISADSTQIYKEMNIGTAKIKDKKNIPHHLIDIKDLNEDYNAFEYQKDATYIINKLIEKNKNIIIVGGTGLYINSLLFDYNFEQKSMKKEMVYESIIIGLTTDRDILYDKLNSRVDDMIKYGLLEETKKLYKKHPNSKQLNSTIGYKEIIKYLNNDITFNEAVEQIKKNTRNYAKRQYTWFNNKLVVKWFKTNYDNFDETIKEVLKYLK